MKPLFNRLHHTASAAAALALQHKRRLLPWLLMLLAAVAALLYMKYAMAATFTVTSTADTGGSTCSGTCTLRQAINAANAAGVGPHTINFNIPGCTSGCTITVTASNPLPALTRAVNINGASQPGYSGTPLIRVHGDSYYFLLFFYSVDTGLELAAGSSGSTIRGLALTNFQANAIIVNSSNNLIAGNYVGTDLTGNTAVANGTGIWLSSGSSNTVGGTTAADRNVIAGNSASGIFITSSSNTVVGNSIGLAANGSTALGNGNAGVWLTVAASNNRIGGVDAASANTIANNALDGITFQGGGSSSGNSMLRNAIFNNGARGIDFNDDGVTLNDLGDADSGPNAQQNFPVVSTAVTNGLSTTVTGSLNSNANTTYRIEFFSNATGDSSGYGEGQVYLGSTSVTTNGSGNASYSVALPVSTTAGHRVSAIATVDLGGGNFGSSSEFALNATVTQPPAGVTASAISGNTTESGGTATFTVVLDRAPTANVTVPVSSSNTTEGTVSTTSLVFTTSNWSTPQTVTVTGQDDTIVDGDRAYTIVLGAATSADTAYNGLNPADVAVTNTDNDTQSTIVVTTNTDVVDGTTTSLYALFTNRGADGQISLREAITAANNSTNGSGGPDIINFAVGSGSFSINLASLLPTLNQPTIINGWSQPGYTGTPLVIIDCNQLSAYGLWLLSGSGGSTVRGLVVRDCIVNGIRVESGSNGNTIVGNYIGSFGAAGTDLGAGERNLGAGIFVASASNFIGGGGTAEGNVIGGNESHGIHISGPTATGNRVQGNYVGLNAAGTAAVANTSDGIRVDSSATGNLIGTNLDGSNDAAEGNVVSGNGGVGIIVGANNTVVQGNYVGLLPDGNTKLGNGGYGIDVLAFVTGATIGSGTAGGGNVVSGNGNAGIIFEVLSSGTVKGNFVGTNAMGSTVLTGNGAALFLATSNVQVGGTTAAEGNIFAGSNTDGIIVSGATSTGNAILGNSIHSNGGLGIDLSDNGVTANDSGDGDTGPNGLQNYPVLTTAVTNGGSQVTITGTLNSVANTNFRIEFFASATGDSSGNGEGQRYLGSTNVTTNGSGNASFSSLLVASVAGGEAISATATRANAGYTVFSDTSEFSANVAAALPPYTLTGTVYEDVNYGGGAGRTQAASSGVGVSGATVELYSADTGLMATTTTNGSGAYSFPVGNGGYFVRVVQSTVSSTRSGSTAALRGVQTWRYEASWLTPAAVTNEVGGARPDVADSSAAATLAWTACAAENATCTFTGTRLVRYGLSPNFTTRVATGSVVCDNATFGDPAFGATKTCAVLQPHLHSASSVHVAGANVSGVNFGFNFNTVTNVNDSGAGSLRQAITNANTLSNTGLAQSGRTAGIDNLVFMISNGTTGSGGSLGLSGGLRASENLFSSGVATITPTSTLPALSTPMVVDGQAQPGWTANPLVHINGASAGGGNGLTVTGGSTVLRGLAVRGFAGAWGISINGSSANTIEGCWVGLNAAGTAASGNGQGVWIDGSSSNVLGGTSSTQRNVLSGNTSNGLVLNSATGTVIRGNYFGLNAAGTAAVANGDSGIVLLGTSTGTVIGGTAAGEGNFIAGNTGTSGGAAAGVSIQASTATGSVIRGNVFGMNAAQSAPIATGGFGIYAPAANTTIGGTTASAGNVITAHSLDGVAVVGASASAVTIQGNSIYGNTGLGIDLADNGATANDGAKTAGQPNLLMDAPVFTSATMSGTTLTVTGYVGSAAGQSTFGSSRVELFVSDNSSASGQGQTYLGFVTTDANGNFSGSIPGVAGITVNSTRITGTATDGSGNTSEFGANIIVSLGISGTVFEDVNYGGGAGRSQAASSGPGLAGATVELYSSAGVWIASTTSTSGGAYSFSGLAAGTYHVRVVNSTVASQRSGSTGALLGVMTYRTNASTGTAVAVTDQVGGTTPAQADAAAGSSGATFNTTTGVFSAVVTGTAQSYAQVVLSSSVVTGVDFGFNFSTVVNTNNAGQGSLRQAITNANALANTGLAQSGRTAGIENLVFMISNGTAAAGLRSANNYFSGGVATIAPTSALPTVTDPLVLDAQTQPGWVLAPLVELNGTNAGAGVSGLTLNAAGSVLRGFVINRFNGEGIYSTAGAGLTIQGNYIGTNTAGSAASPNTLSGIWLSQSDGGHVVGGTTAAQRNVISSQTTWRGLAIAGGSGHVVQGNYIGTSADGTAALGNASDGILIYGGVSNSTIGGTVAGAGNLVRSNGGRGIRVLAGATGVAILGNSIYGNTNLGIDLNNDGITANDGAKTAGGANLLMDAPVFTTATLSATTLTVAGYVGSAANQSLFGTVRVEVFIADSSFANGQGQTYLGFVTTDANGNFSSTITGVSGVTNGSTQITGTATDASGNTSEFGVNVTVGWGISGTVFEDVNYGGGAGRSQATAAGVGLAGATVELYSSAGVWVRSTTTASGGAYSFSGLASGTYHVRVVGSTVQSQRAGSTGALLGVMTYRTTATTGTAVDVTDQVGGTTPSQADAAAGSAGATFNTTTGVFSAVVTGTAQSYAAVALGTSPITGVDFGFNFNTVVNTNNSGAGSLRQAITNANALTSDATLAVAGRTAGLEHVIFMLADGTTRPGLRNTFASQFAAGIAAISPTSALPDISSSLVLDAQMQPGWVQDPIIELRGNAAGAVAGLTLSGGAVTVRGLIINRYGSHGISITGGTAQTVQGCWIGTDATGAAAAANGGAGLSVSSTTSALQIGGTTAAQRNVISGNSSHGLNIAGGASVVLQGNYIGTSALGTAALANGGRGIWLDTAVTTATVGGTAAGAGNTIAASADHGLFLGGGATTVQGNFIGTNASGTAALANAHGIYAASAGHQIGGTSGAARNVVSGNSGRGIWLHAGGSTVQGNHVGTNAAGTAALANADGIYARGTNNVIGGSATGAGNVVSGNSTTGVLLDSLANGTSVRGNTIGLNAALGAALPNGVGVDVSCASGCAVGGTATGEGNVISGNTGAGVRVNAASQGNAILGNRIDSNGGLGIDLNGNGVTVNDGAKTAGAGNLLMDQPVFTSARARGNQLTVAGYVGSAAGQATFANARVEIFSSSADASGYGEGSTYLGSVTTDASGNFSATLTMTQSVLAVGTRLTGTATDTASNTSEFGANFSGLVVDLVVNHNGDAVDANPGDGICQTATPGLCTLRAALQEVNALAAQPSAVTIAFALPGCSAAGQAACTITPASALPAATRAVVVDAQTQPGWTVSPLVELLGSSAGAGSYGLSLTVASSGVRGLVIGGFSQAGIAISANNASIQGNVIGLQPSGTAPRANGAAASVHGGIRVISGTGILIGGTTATQRNVLSGNAGAGLYVDAGTVTVTGNYVGTNAAGTAALGNGRSGIYLAGGSGHQIGGTTAGQGNVISGNAGAQNSGLYVASSSTTIQGNLVGLNAAGSGFIANGDGVSTGAAGIDLASGSGHVVGGSAAGEANVIAGNQGHGIRVTSQTSRISANSIYGNLWRGIDLNADGVTANDGATSGAQPNNGMDHPVVSGAGIDGPGTGITVFGHIGTSSGQAVFAGARVEVFKANNDGSGYGQGATYLGFLTADANGRFFGTLAIPLGAAVVGDAITATATDAAGNTSEFGPNWTSTTVAGLSPAAFNAFETDTLAGALTGVIRSKVAGSAATLAVLALDSAGSAPHPSFTGSVQLNWLDARDDSGAFTGSCRASWLNLGAAGTATFSNSNRVNVSLTPPASSTRAMRLQMVYAGPGGTVTACSNDAFAALPAQLAWIAASDATSASAGTTRTLDNTAASGGVVHQAGRPFTLRAQALANGGALMTGYDGSPTLAITGCVLPAGCTAGTLGGGNVAASAGLYTHNTVTYSEVGAVALQLTDSSYGAVDSADTAAGLRTVTSTSLQVGRFVPDSYAVTVSTSGVLATANGACLASGSGATFLGQGFGWATAPQVTVTARNAAGATTVLWTGSLMKLAPGPGLVPALTVGGALGVSLATSFGAGTVQDLGNGQALLQASALDRFVLDAGSPLASLSPTWQWQLALTDSSEAGIAGNPQATATATQASVGFDQGNSFHSARLSLATAHGDARSGVRMLMELQRYTAAGWVTMTEDRGCVTVQRSQLEMSNPSGVFVGAGVCASPLSSSVTTAGGRAWLQLPASPGGGSGRLAVRVAGTLASGNGCSALGVAQPVVPLALPWLTGGAAGAGPQATATWGLPQRDLVLRREIW